MPHSTLLVHCVTWNSKLIRLVDSISSRKVIYVLVKPVAVKHHAYYDVRWYALNSFHTWVQLLSTHHALYPMFRFNVTPAAGCYFSSNGALPSTSLLSRLTQFRLVSHIKTTETAHIVKQKVCIWQPLRSARESNTEFAEVSIRAQGIHKHPERYVGVNTESSASQEKTFT